MRGFNMSLKSISSRGFFWCT